MDLKQLQAVIGIADTGSFSAAAEGLGTVQSNVSSRVARLERELDVVLVDRQSGRLTQEGEVVVARGRRMLAELEAMVADVASMRHNLRGDVRIGIIGTAGRWMAPLLFAHLREHHPHVHLTVADGTNTTLEPQLVAGKLDLAVVTIPVHDDELSTSPLFEEDLVLVVAVTHELARRHASADGTGAAVPMRVLAEHELILPAAGTSLRDEIDGAAARAGVTLRPAMELDGLRMIASLAFDGYGPAILPASAVPLHQRRDFVQLLVDGLPRRRAGIAMRVRGLPSAPARALIDVLHAIVEDTSVVPAGLHPCAAEQHH